MTNCRAWKVLSDERNCIAIGQGRPEIHRFEVRCFEQKLDKLSRYLNLNDRKRLSKSRYSKTFQLRFVSTKNCSWKIVQLKRKIFQIPVFWKKRINFGARKLKLPPLKVRRFCNKVGTFCPFDTFWKIHPDKNAFTALVPTITASPRDPESFTVRSIQILWTWIKNWRRRTTSDC